MSTYHPLASVFETESAYRTAVNALVGNYFPVGLYPVEKAIRYYCCGDRLRVENALSQAGLILGVDYTNVEDYIAHPEIAQ